MTSLPRPLTAFTQVSAVDTWDADFRWREHAQLRDLTIDDTWERVSAWLADAEPAAPTSWAQRFTLAFAGWQLLPDEALLRNAGTGGRLRFDQSPLAVVNAAAFARGREQGQIRIDHAGLAAAAALAVRVLDDALVVANATPQQPLRIGLIGVANALGRLNIAFDSPAAVTYAGALAGSLLHGCLLGAVNLTQEREDSLPVPPNQITRWRRAGADPELLDSVERKGMRGMPTIGLWAAPRLARLANGMSEGTDPILGPVRTRPHSLLTTGSREGQAADARDLCAQLRLRAAMQPCLDSPLDSPLLTHAPPSDKHWGDILALASQLGLPEPRWRRVDQDANNLSPR